MMLKTSSSSLNPALGLFRFTLRKNIILLILICIAALLFCPGLVLTSLDTLYPPVDMNDTIIPVFLSATAIFTTLLAVLMNIINFLYLFSRRSSDVFHAIPLTRCELLFSRFFAGFAFALVPMLLCHLSLALLTLLPGVNGDLLYILVGFFCNVLTALVCSAFSLIFIVCAGTAFDFLLSFGGVSVSGMLIGAIMLYAYDELLTGYRYNPHITRILFSLLSPYFLCGYGYYGLIDSVSDGLSPLNADVGLYLLKAVLLAAALLTAAALLYRRRPAERSGESYAYRWTYVLCSLGLCFVGAFGFGALFSDDGITDPVFWIFALLGSLLVAVIFGAISDRGFKTLKRSLIPGLCSFVALILVAVTLSTDGFGYSTRVPQAQQIKSVNIRFNGESITFDDPEEVLALHRAIVKDLNLLDTEYDVSRPQTYLYLDYELKNGTAFSREFFIPVRQFSDQLLTVYTSDTHIATMRQQLKTAPSLLTLSWYSQSEEAEKYGEAADYATKPLENLSATVTREEAERLIAAYTADLKGATEYSIGVSGPMQEYYLEWIVAGSSWEHSSIALRIEPGFTETQAVLVEFDLSTRAAAEAQNQSE